MHQYIGVNIIMFTAWSSTSLEALPRMSLGRSPRDELGRISEARRLHARASGGATRDSY